MPSQKPSPPVGIRTDSLRITPWIESETAFISSLTRDTRETSDVRRVSMGLHASHAPRPVKFWKSDAFTTQTLAFAYVLVSNWLRMQKLSSTPRSISPSLA